MLWTTANTFIKLSITDLYIRMLVTKRVLLYFVNIVVLLHFAVVVLGAFLMCRPLARTWDKSIRGTCGDEDKLYLAIEVSNLAIDVLILIIPLEFVWNSSMTVKEKIRFTSMFSAGSLLV